MPNESVRIEGVDKLVRRFKKLERAYGMRGELLEGALLGASKIVRRRVQANAPLGPTGNLRRSVVAKKFNYQLNNKPAAFCAIDRRIAPHAHLVEYGTAERHWKSGKSTGHMPAKPFFKPGVEQSTPHVRMYLKSQIQELLKRAVRR